MIFSLEFLEIPSPAFKEKPDEKTFAVKKEKKF